MFCSFLLNWKSLGLLGGSETFPWQLGLVSAEANCGSCLNRSDGNGASPECGLMLSLCFQMKLPNCVLGEAAGLLVVS